MFVFCFSFKMKQIAEKFERLREIVKDLQVKRNVNVGKKMETKKNVRKILK